MADEQYVELTSLQVGAIVNEVVDATLDTNDGINLAATFSSSRTSASIDKNGQGEIQAGFFVIGLKFWDVGKPLKFKIDINKLGLGVGTEFLGAQITFSEADENGIMLAEAKLQFAGFCLGGTGAINLTKIDAKFTEWLTEVFTNSNTPFGKMGDVRSGAHTRRALEKFERENF